MSEVTTYNGVREWEIPYRGMTPSIAIRGGSSHSTVLSWVTEDGVRQQTIDTYVGWSTAAGFSS